MFFSIIIPAYNVEDYITRCIRSACEQDFNRTDFEVICVDDCSTDRTPEILSKLAAKYSNLTVVRHSVNKRQGGGRNTVLNLARGEYVLFLDADDCFLYKNTLRTIAGCLQKERTDILRTTGFKNIGDDFDAPMAEFGGPLPSVRRFARNDYFATVSFSNAVCDTCFRRSLLAENRLRFREHVAFEDTDWLLIALYHARTISIMDFPFYGYRQTRGSTTRTPHIDALRANAQGVFAALRYFDADHIDPFVCRIVR